MRVLRVSKSLRPHGLQLTRLLCPWDLSGKNTGAGCHPTPGDLPDPGIESASLAFPALADGFFTTASPGKPAYNIIYRELIIH